VASEATPRSGVWLSVRLSDYLAWDAVDYTALKALWRSPKHYQESGLRPPEQTRAQLLGTAIHVAVLERARFEREFAEAPPLDRRTKEGKERWAEFLASHPGAEVLSHDEMESVRGAAGGLLTHPVVEACLSGRGANEASVIWDEPEFGLRAKARPDRIGQLDGEAVVLDLKTTTDASPGAFGRAFGGLGYHLQLAMMSRGLEVVAPTASRRRLLIAAVEKDPPYACAVYEPTPAAIEAGLALYRSLLARLRSCLDSGVFPGYGDGVIPLELPRWAAEASYTVVGDPADIGGFP